MPIYGVEQVSNYLTTKEDIKRGINRVPPDEFRLDKEEQVRRESVRQSNVIDPFFSDKFLADHLNEIEDHEEALTFIDGIDSEMNFDHIPKRAMLKQKDNVEDENLIDQNEEGNIKFISTTGSDITTEQFDTRESEQ